MGYVGTGSSAIVHLLKEYEKVNDVDTKNYEHNVLYVPHGIFDLEDDLLKNNTMEKSDVAINDFYREMKNLNDNDYGWFGGFEKKYGSVFMDSVDELLNSLIIYTRSGGWSYDYRYKFELKQIIKDCIKFIIRRPIKRFGYKLDLVGDDNKVNFAFPTEEEFYEAAKKFVDNYFSMIGCANDKTYIFDQLLKPQQLYRINHYFDEDTRFIVVDRDPRDTYLLNKYIWSESRPYFLTPPNADDFIKYYARHYQTEKLVEDKRILRIHFEDLIYKYDETVQKIEDFIGKENLGEHKYIKKFLNPEISIKNTQIFNINPKWKEEVKVFENSELQNHIYDFPYVVNSNVNDVTDPDPDTSIKNK